MGRLDDEIHGAVGLCPQCHRLNFTRSDPESPGDFVHVMFKCEQRTYSREMVLAWMHKKELAHARMAVMDIPVEDPGPGLQGKLHVRECPLCSRTRIKPDYLRFMDLDEMAELKNELKPNALTLRGTRR